MRVFLLLLVLLSFADAAEESCIERCENGFDATKSCQCDSMCTYYKSCCTDYESLCRIKARGDTFPSHPEDDYDEETNSTEVPIRSRPQVRVLSPSPLEISSMVTPVLDTANEPTPVVATAATPTNKNPATTPGATTTAQPTPTKAKDPDAEVCSGRPFDAFMQLKNGSIFAFRGDYFFELDDRSVMPGYPKLIKDVWGINGPIDAAFTRINCQGKTYIFKGNKYWRFDGDVLDEDYPRDIAVGFEKIPDDVDAAFAIPAPGHHGREKVYFFKGDQYYQYEFKHQPSHEECDRMTKSSPSVAFTRYTDLYCDFDIFDLLFQGAQGHHKGPRFISKDWIGIKPPVDAAMVGRLYVNSSPSPSPSTSLSRGQNTRRRLRGSKARVSRSLFWEDFGLDYEERYFGTEKQGKKQKKGRGRRPSLFDMSYDPMDYVDVEVVQEKATPVQNVYFFKKDKYYRVDLQTKRIDRVTPPYPRSIGKYWLGCKEKDLSEKR